jgi:hypothetical protein
MVSVTKDTGVRVSEEMLEKLALGQLAETELRLIEQQILLCEACQDRLSEVDEFIKTFQRVADKNGSSAYQCKPGCGAFRATIN